MKRRKPLFKKGDLGWSMGDACKVILRRKTPFGYVYVLQIAQIDLGKVNRTWIEAATQIELIGINRQYSMGPDCNGDLPKKEWFK